ncbi:MAG: DEAD/DEAH box helicase [Myxococcales bacterium]|nr:DEAD/DEAH box helicase [Myxococcales bacterium]
MSTGSADEPFGGPRKLPWTPALRGLDDVFAHWEAKGVTRDVVLDETLPPRPARTVPLPEDLDVGVRRALLSRGITELYAHQAAARALGQAGRSFVVATPTASGKSLCYNLPILERLAVDPDARALYLFPTKALSRDQEAALRQLMGDAGLPHGAITFDGDTPGDARRVARERSGVILTNPDMLHAGILPHHAGWARVFSNLRYVVLDELHTYRGVFGSHLANVIRRLRRVAAFHGSSPVFVGASATIGNPGEHAARILGEDEVEVISESGAPTGPRRVVVYNPPLVNAELGIRASYLKSAVRLTTDLVRAGVPTLVFGQSRNGVEVMLKYLRDRLQREAGLDASALHAYRGGYLPKQRRAIEAQLRSGDIRCVVATNALELGIDIGALDAVVCAGYPGTLAATWQRFGRAGRREAPALGVLVTSSMPLDQYVARDARQLLDAPVEHARIDPDNPEILVQHLKCAAFELPFEEGDRFGRLPTDDLEGALGFLTDHGVVHPSPDGSGKTVWHWATDHYPANGVSLRSVGWDNFVIIDLDTDRTIAEMDWRSTHTMLHEQAIYQHAAEQYQVERLDFENHKAYVRLVKPDYYTTAMTHTKVTVTDEDRHAEIALRDGGHVLPIGFGEVSVVEKVVGYKKIKFHTHENVGYGDVHLPEMQMHTTALWLTFPEPLVAALLEALRVPRAAVVDAFGGLLASMHVVGAIGLMVDPRDLGQTLGDMSDPSAPGSSGHGATGFDPTLFLYDQVPGGVGLASRLFEEREALLRRARTSVAGCACEGGCPACIGPGAGLETEATAGVLPRRKALVLALLDHLGIGSLH